MGVTMLGGKAADLTNSALSCERNATPVISNVKANDGHSRNVEVV